MTVIETLRMIKHKTRVRTRYRGVKKKLKTVGYVYRTNGAQGVSMHIKSGIKKRMQQTTPASHAGDVLMISIHDALLDRYRTEHMIESLESVGMSVGKVFYDQLTLDHIKRYNVFIFYRCPWLPQFEDILKDIKRKNKVSIFAVDDLVIDRKYTDTLPVVQRLNREDRAIYDDGVERHNKLMKRCDYAITTTQALADELTKYKNLKDVYIDRNSMSDEMIYHANKAIDEVKKDNQKVIIGYFSGTDTHNEDFQMVSHAIVRILDDHKNVYIKLMGRIDAPDALKGYEDRLIFSPYVDWRQLPFELRQCDIGLAPLVDTLFNRAKSEIKWSELALVGVPVIASNMGAFKESVKNGSTGILVENTEEDWYKGMNLLVNDAKKRTDIAKTARDWVLHQCTTTGARAVKLQGFLDAITPKVIAFGGVNISAISGGNMVVKKHMDILRDAGCIVYGVESMDYYVDDQWQALNNHDDQVYDIFRINSHRIADKVSLTMRFDRFVATFWDSVKMVDGYRFMKPGGEKLYLVQNMEADFYSLNDRLRREVMSTYRNHRLNVVTISKWCQKWLQEDFGRHAKYAPNGIDLEKFQFETRSWGKRKTKILIEGDSSSEYKRVDESFAIANLLDREKFEVSYLSYNAEPKEWYKPDNTYIKVPYDDVGKIYQNHDILLKSSLLESFSYPPLEMMATGGVPVLVKNDGNAEYVEDGVNALYYDSGDIAGAAKIIGDIATRHDEFNKLAVAGRETAEARAWHGKVEEQVVHLYE